VYLLSDVQDIIAEYMDLSKANSATWHFDKHAWMAPKIEAVAARREFARSMEFWEEATRSTKSWDYREKKDARKEYFLHKASQLSPSIGLDEMEMSSAYRRAVAIPRDPSMNSWLLLKPKLEMEVAELRGLDHLASSNPSSQNTNPSTPLMG
jgi:ketosteroid isomerase-like protein